MNLSWSRLRNRAAILWSYATRKPTISGGPNYIWVEATGKCNLFCPMCPRESAHREPVDIPMPLFQKIVEEAHQHLEFIMPFGQGEPMLNKRIFEMIRFCRERNIRVGLSTNGTLNNPEVNRKILESGLDYLIFSFDGASKETYEKYRKGAIFEETRNKILDFLKMKLEMRSNIFINVEMVRLKDNAHEVNAFRKMWNLPGVDQQRILEDQTQYEGVAIPRPKEQAPRHSPCKYLWTGPVYIDYNGNVFPCCLWGAMRNDEPVGNAKEHSVAGIWNNEKMQKLRQAHIAGRIEGYRACLHCKAPRPRLMFFLGYFMANGLAVRKIMALIMKLKIPIFENRPVETPKEDA